MRRLRLLTAMTGSRWNGTGKTFVSPLTVTAASLMVNFKAVPGHRFFQLRFGLLANVCAQFALHDRIQKRPDFLFLAIHLKLNPAVGQVAHPTGQIETFGNVPHRPPAAHTLNAALVTYLQ